MKIERENELEYMMRFLGIKEINLENRCGKIILTSDKLEYDHSNSTRYYTNDYFALKAAMNELGKDVEKIREFLKIKDNIFNAALMRKENDGTKPVKLWVYLSDIKDSGVEVIAGKHHNPETRFGMPMVDKGGDVLVLRGNINQLRKFLSYANNHLRYINGSCYVYENEELTEMMRIFKKYGLYESYDSFCEYYHNSIVD